MRNFKIALVYDGFDFHGWQVQPDRPTVQGALSDALRRVTGESVIPQGSGRTDAGVHACGQVASFASASPIPVANLVIALNDTLPATIRVLNAQEVPAGFHPRRDAKAKTYAYRIYRGDVCPPFLARYVWHYPYPLDTAAMQQAETEVIGEHDFTSFAAVDPERGREEDQCSNMRTILNSQWGRLPAGAAGPGAVVTDIGYWGEAEELIYTVRGSGFLHHMVRNLVGTFLLVGKGTLKPGDLSRILNARSRAANPGATAPPHGLYLASVEY